MGGGELARMATLPTSGGLHAPCCLGFQAWALTGQGGQRRRVASTHTRAPGAVAPELPPQSRACSLHACLRRDPCLSSLRRKSKAKPNGKKPAAEEKKVYLEPEYAKSRITDFGFKELVVLPREIDLNEWLASNSAWGRGWGGAGQALVSPGTPGAGAQHLHAQAD